MKLLTSLALVFGLASGACAAAETPPNPATKAAAHPVHILVWDERQPAQKAVYPDFLGNQIAAHLKTQPGFVVNSVCLGDPEQGLSEKNLDGADVLIWWSHMRQREVTDAHAQAVLERLKAGKLNLIVLHSAHFSKPFMAAMQERAIADALATLTPAQRQVAVVTCHPFKAFAAPAASDRVTPFHEVKTTGDKVELSLTLPNCCFPAYRADGAPSHVHTLLPAHPIAQGIPATFDIPQTEMYNEPFHVPAPDAVIFEEKWDKGEHFRSGMVWNIGKGQVFYFRPGHETFGIYHQAEPLQILVNAARWLGPKD